MMNKYINYLFILILSCAPSLSVWSQQQQDNTDQVSVLPPLTEQTGDATPPDAVPFVELRQAVDRYSERVDRLESEYGAWYPGLQEELIGLGQTWMNIGGYEAAINVFTRAMHINRINEGLYSLTQQDTLKHIIDANIQAQDSEAHTDNYAYLIWLYDNNDDADIMQRASAYQ